MSSPKSGAEVDSPRRAKKNLDKYKISSNQIMDPVEEYMGDSRMSH